MLRSLLNKTTRRAVVHTLATVAEIPTFKSERETLRSVSMSVLVAGLVSMSLCGDDHKKSFSFPVAITHCDPEYYTVPELSRLLREKLQPGREKMRRQGRAVPTITARAVNFGGRPGQLLEISFLPQETHATSALVSAWLDAIDDSPSPSPQANNKKTDPLQRFRAFCANKHQTTLSILSPSNTGTMTVTKYLAADQLAPRLSISLLKNDGFSSPQVESIVLGYTEAFNVAGNNKTPRDPLDVQVDAERAPPHEGDLRGVLERHFRSSSSPLSETTDEEATRGKTSDAAAEALRALGVEVFDREHNARLTWDDLAGYEQIKREIEDTVIHALQFPEIYDEIAQQTRVRFESNRPKALLLEGPPGTGKTLTARILASQVDAPLVVLKLESIVSKWYGDSEKKLSKILDHCDALPNAILFVDEIDALTQSRDSESGVHEVSKRILSVLLQRLEGFHGKSKSLLICTTNRQQDLDKALLSRFDLIIPYDLPDLSTRVEIFKRYAKQFATNTTTTVSVDGKSGEKQDVFAVLGRASEGLSCRDLKEACEHAERKCASRLVKHKLGKSDETSASTSGSGSGSWIRSMIPGAKTESSPSPLPVLDDYLDSIRLKTMERHNVRHGQRPEAFSSV